MDEPSCEDARVIRQEARARLKKGEAVKIFGHSDELSKWLEDSDVSEDSVKHLIYHAGGNIDHKLGDEVSFFLHAPFSDDCDDVKDKNDPSVVMQMRLYNNDTETNVLVTGDVTCEVIDDIVRITQNNDNEDYLKWDLYDIPHHCSTTGLCSNPDEGVTPTDNVQWLLEQSGSYAYIVASCKALVDADSPPPSAEAADAYKAYTGSDVTFCVTMEWRKKSSPEPMIFTVNERGLKPKPPASTVYFSSPAPRAG